MSQGCWSIRYDCMNVRYCICKNAWTRFTFAFFVSTKPTMYSCDNWCCVFDPRLSTYRASSVPIFQNCFFAGPCSLRFWKNTTTDSSDSSDGFLLSLSMDPAQTGGCVLANWPNQSKRPLGQPNNLPEAGFYFLINESWLCVTTSIQHVWDVEIDEIVVSHSSRFGHSQVGLVTFKSVRFNHLSWKAAYHPPQDWNNNPYLCSPQVATTLQDRLWFQPADETKADRR